MSYPRHHHHWLFRRDEIDVIDDVYLAVLRRHRAMPDLPTYPLEEAVFKEQVTTERAANQEAEAPEFADHQHPPEALHDCQKHIYDAIDAAGSVQRWLWQDTRRDPLYERVLRWAMAAYQWSQAVYYGAGHKMYDVFRVQMNCYLVPLRLADVHFQHTDDCVSPNQRCFLHLAGIYLQRTRDSLVILRAQGVLPPSVFWLISEAEALGEQIRAWEKRL